LQIAVHYATNDAEAHETAKLLGDACAGTYRFDFVPGADPAALWEAVNEDGPVGALVNNAGIYRKLDFLGADDATFERNCTDTMAVNFGAPLSLIRCACKSFGASGGGKIVNIASRVGFKGEAGAALYAASKAALISLTRSLAVELAGKRIQLFAVAPG
jgi:3-oxoacyl-[acyl-carrier protein] reductase